ncbi:hypothetical protein RND81_12G008300 [Saponaria officinalis]|uniref:Uncharacterized protein n=1 Tax=Saponaria officinalis TaxID=3572 RepID=A0AAW1H5U5_SAPOF
MANFKYCNNNNKNNGGNWKKPKDDNFHGNSMPGSHINRKISSVNGRQLSAHQLEERFCATIGGVSLQEIVENQRYMYQHKKILEWNDSAVEEAFRDAKNRFLANIHGQPCDIKLPDPDIFNDNVNWNSTVDPDLLSDLENRDLDSSSEIENKDGGVVVGIPSVICQSDFTPTGWGDAEYVNPRQDFCEKQVDVGNDGWADSGFKRDETKFSNGWEDDYVYVAQNMVRDGENRVNGQTWNSYRKQQRDYGYNRKGDHGGWGTSRYKISRFQHNNYAQPLDNYGGKRGNFSCERPLLTWKPVTRRW